MLNVEKACDGSISMEWRLFYSKIYSYGKGDWILATRNHECQNSAVVLALPWGGLLCSWLVDSTEMVWASRLWRNAKRIGCQQRRRVKFFAWAMDQLRIHEAEMSERENDWRNVFFNIHTAKRKFFEWTVYIQETTKKCRDWGIGASLKKIDPNRGLEIQECWFEGIF